MGLTTEQEASTLSRSTWAAILERDLLLDLLHTSERFRDGFLASGPPELVSHDATPMAHGTP
jgi:hypothetical protein